MGDTGVKFDLLNKSINSKCTVIALRAYMEMCKHFLVLLLL